MIKSALLLAASVLFLSSCEFLKFKNTRSNQDGGNENAIARVNELFLYPKDLEGIVPDGDAADSAGLIEQHIKSWIKKQLLISEAQQQLNFDEVEIERKVLDYRYALMMHEFEKIYVNNTLNTQVSQEEVQEYYQENLDNFELDQNIIRGIFVQLPKGSPKLARFRSLLRSQREGDFEELKTYCYSYARKAHLEDSVWVFFSDLTSYTPLQDISDEKSFLRNNKFVETSDKENMYFFRIDDYKLQTETSPLEFVDDEIRKIIIHRRKVKLAKDLEDQIYDRAIENDDFEIY
jgi:hypothetical protein